MSQNPNSGYESKLTLVKSLYQRGLSREDIVELFRLIDWLIALPETQERRLWAEMESLEKESGMPYITNVERFGVEKGRQEGFQEGLQEGRKEGILRILEVRFGEVSEELRAIIGTIRDLEVLETLLVQSVTAQSIEAIDAIARQIAPPETVEWVNPESTEIDEGSNSAL